jgi:superfamily II DNA or RNA helicase
MTKILSSRGYNVPKDLLTEQDMKEMKDELTVSAYVPEDFAQNRPQPFKLYQESSTRIYIPKYYGFKKFGKPDVNKLPEGADIDVEFCGSLRDYQIEPVQKFMNAAKDPTKMGGIINLFCGAGKTTLAIYIMCHLKKKTMIICHKDFLLQQWKERIEQFAPKARIGLVKAKTIDVENKDVILASLQSISMKTYDSDLFNDISFVCFDEVHHLGAEVFSQALKKLTVSYALGLSATVKRKDGLTKVFQWYLGDIVYKAAKRKDELEVRFFDYYDPNPNYSLEIKGFRNTLMMPRMINNICDYPPRIAFVIKALQDVLKKEPTRKIIILSERLNQLKLLHEGISKIGIGCAYYVGGMKQHDLKQSEEKQVILATYHIAAEGFDCPGLDTLILASPKSDVIQCVGRIQRTPQHLRKHKPLVLDIIDNFSMFAGQARKRHTYYKSCKYDIVGGDVFTISKTQNVKLSGPSFIDVENDGEADNL